MSEELQNAPPSERQSYHPPSAQHMTLMGAFVFYVAFFAFVVFLAYFTKHEQFATLLTGFGSALGALLAVAYALFSGIIQEKLFPIRVCIKTTKENNISDSTPARDQNGTIINIKDIIARGHGSAAVFVRFGESRELNEWWVGRSISAEGGVEQTGSRKGRKDAKGIEEGTRLVALGRTEETGKCLGSAAVYATLRRAKGILPHRTDAGGGIRVNS